MNKHPVSRLAARARQLGRRQLVYYGFLLAVAVGLGLFLASAPRPWEEGVAAREAAGRNVKAAHYAVSGLYYGGWTALAVVALLAACGPLALRRLGPGFVRSRAGIGRRSAPAFLIFTAAAMLIAGVRMAPRLDSSLWGDEDYTVRRAILGQYERDADGKLWFREATWTDTLFAYKSPNNHMLFSILARLSMRGYDPGDDPAKLHFDETRLRLPSFVAALVAVAAAGYLLATLGYTRAGVAAMFILSLHPWLLRHGPEARGYPLALALGPLCLAFLIKALQRGRPGYWAAFALCESLVFYAYPGTLYLLCGINIAALLYLATRELARRDRVTLAARWFTANTLAALPLVFLMAPNLPQMKAYMAKNSGVAPPGAAWLWDNLCYLATGVPWRPWEAGNPYDFHLSAQPVSAAIALAVVFGLAALGATRIWRTGGRRWLLVALTLPYALMVGHSMLYGGRVYHWYAVPMLPAFVILLAMGVEHFPSRIGDVRLRTLSGLGALALFLAFYTAITAPQTRALRERPVGPLRESVARTRPDVVNPNLAAIGEVLTAQFCMGTPGYDPTAYFFKKDDPDAFRALMARADAQEKPLFVNIALPALARLQWPAMMAIIDDPQQFDPLPPIWGLQAPCTRYVFQYRGSGR